MMVELLMKRLAHAHPQVVQKALHVIIALTKADGCDDYKPVLSSQASNLAALQGSASKPSVRSLAGKVSYWWWWW